MDDPQFDHLVKTSGAGGHSRRRMLAGIAAATGAASGRCSTTSEDENEAITRRW